MIGNAHLDPVWLWRWQEGCSEVLATFRSALDRMKEFDDYIFTCAGAAYYRWVEEMDPAMFEEIRQRVAEGRWVIVGGWWIQPDCNAPSGESFARHALYSQRYYREKFGVQAEIGYNVDSFGHNAMLPQLLRESGLRGYVFMRPSPDGEMKYPFSNTSFLWEGADGTQMPTFRISTAYGTNTPEQMLERAEQALSRANESGIPDMCFYGIGNHGGGPSIETLKAVEKRLAEPDGGEFAFSSPNAFFDALKEQNLPVLKGELQHHASGCYTTVMEVKELNRRAEQRLLAAEKYAALAAWLSCEVDTAPLAEAWQTVLFNQFHDIMGGCCLREAMDDAVIALKHALHVAQQITNSALQKLSWRVDTSRGEPVIRSKTQFRVWSREGLGTPMLVFNPHSWPVRTVLRTGTDIGAGADVPRIELSDGTAVPYQRARGSMVNGKEDKWESAFVAELPAMGWTTFWLKRDDCKRAEPVSRMLEATDTHLENDWLSVDFDPATGEMTRLYDKAGGRELLERATGSLVIDETHADTWAHWVFEFRNVVGSFSNARVELVESGEVFAKLRITSEYGKSTIKRYATLYRELPELYLSYTVTWNEAHRVLKFSFPTPFRTPEVSAIPGGAMTRTASGMEEPMQNWVSLGGLSIVTDTRAAYDAQDGELRLTALRSPAYADHFGGRDDFCEPMAQGEHRFELALTAQTDPAELTRLARQLVCPPERILGTYHVGPLPEVEQGASVSGGVLIDAVKRAEDGSGWIVRACEAAGSKTHARIELNMPNGTIEADFAPWQVKTFLLSDAGDVAETDFTEAIK